MFFVQTHKEMMIFKEIPLATDLLQYGTNTCTATNYDKKKGHTLKIMKIILS
jgi:hypothetical protein